MNKWVILYSSILHDIGKVYQRFGERGKHQEVGANKIKELLDFDCLKDILDNIHDIILRHHDREDDEVLKLVKKADRLSAMEREYTEEVSTAYGLRVEKAPFTSPFWTALYKAFKLREEDFRKKFSKDKFDEIKDRILNEQNIINVLKEAEVHIPAKPLDIVFTTDSVDAALEKVKSLSPRKLEKASESNRYDRVVESLKDSFNKLKNLVGNGFKFKLRGLYNTIDSILEKSLFFVPAGVYKSKVTDISLYAHLLTTSAIALSLYNSINGNFCFLALDISGIQRFISSIARTEKASVMMRGKSLLLDLIQRACSEYIVRQLDLEKTNVVVCAGGYSLLIIPDVDESKMDEIQKTLDEFCLDEFGGEIYVSLAKSDAIEEYEFSIIDYIIAGSGKDNKIPKIVNIFDEMQRKLERNKARRFSRVQWEAKGEFELCELCKRPVKKDELIRVDEFKLEGINKCCKACLNSYIAGFLSRNLAFIVEIKGNVDVKGIRTYGSSYRYGVINFNKLNISYLLVERVTEHGESDWLALDQIIKELGIDRGEITVIRLNSTDFIPNPNWIKYLTKISEKTDIGFKFDFLNTYAPWKRVNGRIIKSFDEICLRNESMTLLCICKIDADNMGAIFSDLVLSPSRYVTASKLLRFFFNILATLIALKEEYKEHVMTIFSGGDDALIVGRFDILMKYIKELNLEFDKWFKRDLSILHGELYGSSMSITAGAYIANPKMPVHVTYHEALRSLERGKEEGRDRITVYGGVIPKIEKLNDKLKIVHSLSWDEFREMINKANEVEGLITSGIVSKTLLHRIHKILTDIAFLIERKFDKNLVMTKIKIEDFADKIIHYVYLANRLTQQIDKLIDVLGLERPEDLTSKNKILEFIIMSGFRAYVTNHALTLLRELI